MRRPYLAALLCCLAACGAHFNSSTQRFEGGSNALLAPAMVDFFEAKPFDASAVDHSTRALVHRDRVGVWLSPTATVGQVQPLFDALQAKVISSMAERTTLVIRFPDPGSLERLNAIAAQLQASPGVKAVILDEMLGVP